MKIKCPTCRGKGGHVRLTIAGFFRTFIACWRCQGKGKEFSNHKPKRAKGQP